MAKPGFPGVAIPASADRDVQIAVQNIRARLEAIEKSSPTTQTVNAQVAALAAAIAAAPKSSSSGSSITSLSMEQLSDWLTNGIITAGQFVQWSGANWTNVTVSGINFTASPTAPASPKVGDRWVNTSNGVQYTWFNDGSGNQWVQFF